MIVPLTPEYLKAVTLNVRDIDRREMLATSASDDPMDVAMLSMQISQSAYAVLNRKKQPVMVGGIAIMTPMVGTAWMWGVPGCEVHALEFTRFSRDVTRMVLRRGFVHRLQAFSAAFHTDAHRWLEAIGLKREGEPMRKYGKDGEDFLIFAATGR